MYIFAYQMNRFIEKPYFDECVKKYAHLYVHNW